ncbi:hypothetical protein CUS93_12615 [Enterococcus faecium]|nr:hypothetical protein CUS93_12615 [Enterococcus faecium]
MVGFLEKQLERQIMLICLLSMDMAEINDLAEELKVTDKTIIADIDNFKPVVLVNFNILKNISKFLQNVVVLDLIEHCKPVICFQIYSLAL